MASHTAVKNERCPIYRHLVGKGDAKNPDVRCRLVCQEVNRYDPDKFFVATPPPEALRTILSFVAEDSRRQVS